MSNITRPDYAMFVRQVSEVDLDDADPETLEQLVREARAMRGLDEDTMPGAGMCLCGRPATEGGYCDGFLSGQGPCTTQPVPPK